MTSGSQVTSPDSRLQIIYSHTRREKTTQTRPRMGRTSGRGPNALQLAIQSPAAEEQSCVHDALIAEHAGIPFSVLQFPAAHEQHVFPCCSGGVPDEEACSKRPPSTGWGGDILVPTELNGGEGCGRPLAGDDEAFVTERCSSDCWAHRSTACPGTPWVGAVAQAQWPGSPHSRVIRCILMRFSNRNASHCRPVTMLLPQCLPGSSFEYRWSLVARSPPVC
ncbi:hypothetical protein B0T25DRAFT_239883 [Lasiosphaeria hispida]|uniref:Uncharacterized protein n=1 Tax=Lasiosphaeria hispida TaxID=260671 RepID=A0AAJ0MC83_9PEZI|nr:hypothetical protein B0T25DRAFT_239883 [Lasiosphaeria hispida]